MGVGSWSGIEFIVGGVKFFIDLKSLLKIFMKYLIDEGFFC